jgi:hypothetical protein
MMAYNNNLPLQSIIDYCPENDSFEDGWEHVKEIFPLLHTYVGEIAIVFPGTSTVEALFSALKWYKDEFCAATTDFLFEGVLHAMQYKVLH